MGYHRDMSSDPSTPDGPPEQTDLQSASTGELVSRLSGYYCLENKARLERETAL